MMESKYNVTISQELPSSLDECAVPWIDSKQLLAEDHHVKIYRDMFPVSPGHLLFVPKYNTMHILAEAFSEAVRYGQHRVELAEWNGFNVGLNYGVAAGQTVKWPHIHLIPRYDGDVETPAGGVRNLLNNGLGNYTKGESQ